MNTEALTKLALKALNEMKAKDVTVMDVKHLTTICDTMIIATGTSSRHVKSIADYLIETSKKAEVKPLGIEGDEQADWVLADLGDVIVHIMRPEVREFYQLEKLWDIPETT